MANVLRQEHRGHPASPELALHGVAPCQCMPECVELGGALPIRHRGIVHGEVLEHGSGQLGGGCGKYPVRPLGALAGVQQPGDALAQCRICAARRIEVRGARIGWKVERAVHRVLNLAPPLRRHPGGI